MISDKSINDLIKDNRESLKVLLELLERKYPPPIITPITQPADIYYDAGQFSVIEHLRSLLTQ